MSALKQTIAMGRRITDRHTVEYRALAPVLITSARSGLAAIDPWTAAYVSRLALIATLYSPWSWSTL